MEVMAFIERTVTRRVKKSTAPRGGPTAELKVIHQAIPRYCQQWQRKVRVISGSETHQGPLPHRAIRMGVTVSFENGPIQCGEISSYATIPGTFLK